MHFSIIQNILIILIFSIFIVFALQRLRLPSILGFLLTGILIGPYALNWLKTVDEVEFLSEIGIILLLFVIGLEMSIKNLINMKKTVFIGGSLQVGGTILITTLITLTWGTDIRTAVFIGFLTSLSSTAIVLKLLHERNDLTTPHGRNALGILIFQDIIVVPMMLFTPLLAGKGGELSSALPFLFLKIGGVALITYLGAKFIIPRALDAVAQTKNKELFLLTTIALCFAVAFLTSEAGLSLALGAFLAGLIISESDYSHQSTSAILPFRELFISFFFISVGMLLDLNFFFANFGLVSLMVLGVFLIKSLIVATAVAILKYPPRIYFLTGISLFQIGEFSFILSKVGVEYGLLSKTINQYFLAVSIVTMLLTPFVLIFSEKMTSRFFRIRLIKFFLMKLKNPFEALNESHSKIPFQNHLIIIGYGVSGRHLAQAAQYKQIPFIVIELNSETAREEKKKGIPILFGDATHEHILKSAHLTSARSVVIVISDRVATRMIVSHIRLLSPSIYILVRTRYIKEMNEFIAMGANDVIPEEFETSIQIFSRILNNFLIPEDDIESFIETLRTDNYKLFEGRQKTSKNLRPNQIPDFNITSLRVLKDSGKLIGKPLHKINLRKNYNINILAITRQNKLIDHIAANETLCLNDILYVHGKPEKINQFRDSIS